MTVTWPDGVVDSPGDGSGPELAETTGTSAATMLGLAAAYQTAQYRLSTSAEQASVRLWQQQRPLTNGDLTGWMLSWNALLSGYAAQQAALTRAYANVSLSRFGTSLPSVSSVDPFPTDVEGWLASDQGRLAPASLRDAARRAQDAIQGGTGTVQDAALVNRLAYLHSPVVKQRWNVSEGVDFDTALEDVSTFVSGQAYNAGRDVESLLMDAANWPSFKNGTAMVYKRVPQAGACGWCLLVATRLWSLAAKTRAEKKPFHAACRCSWALVTYDEAQAYSGELGKSGNYYAAAQRIGNWQGPLPDSYQPILAQRANVQGTTTAPRPAASSTPSAPRVDPRREARAQALVAESQAIYTRARAAAADGDFVTAKRLYEEAGRLTSQAYDLRINR